MNLVGNDWLWAAWTQTWQVTVLIAAVALFARFAAANRPQLAFVLWLVVFSKCVTPPLWSSPSGAFCWLQPPQTTIAERSQGTLAVAVLPSDAPVDSSSVSFSYPLPDAGDQAFFWGLDVSRPATWLTLVWIAGTVAMVGAIAVRWRRLAKLVGHANRGEDPSWEAMFNGLACRLRLRCRVQLRITERSVGPAVLGLFRPTVLLPRAVIEGKSADEIELILAHELIHVRRGDPWFALLRSLVLSLWWFHPLVWWAGRRASREAERCCDDAVLAELRCSPARYARCLLDILEIKHRLSPVPAFPGVRAIEITQGRLERIMKIGQGGCRRTPWWCWGVALLAAIAALPGAAIPISASEGSGDSMPVTSPRPVVKDWAAASQLEAHAPPPNMKYIVAYYVADVLSREDCGLSESAAKEYLEARVKCCTVFPTQGSHQFAGIGRLTWHNDSLIVHANRAGHEHVGKMFEAFRKFGTAQIAIEVRFVTIPAEELQKVLPDSTISPLTADGAALANSEAIQPVAYDRPLGTHEGTRVARAQLVVEKESPVRFRIVDKEEGEKLIEHFQGNKRTNLLQAPKFTIFSGQTAFVSDTSQSPFVVGVIPVGSDAQQPQIRRVSEGTSLQLRPVAERSGAIHLDFAATFSKVEDVDSVCFNRTPTSGTTIQIPKVTTLRMEGGAVLKPGQVLLLGGAKAENEVAVPEATPASWKDWLFGGGKRFKRRESQELVLILRAEKLDTLNPKRLE